MKQEDVGAAMRETTTELSGHRVSARNRTALLTEEEVARIVFTFLTRLVARSGFVARQVLRFVRGLVADWMRSHGYEVPETKA